MFTITEETRQKILEIFDINEEFEFFYGSKKTSKQKEKEYLEEKANNPDLKFPSILRFSTITGIEHQIEQFNTWASAALNDERRPIGLDLNTPQVLCIKQILQEGKSFKQILQEGKTLDQLLCTFEKFPMIEV